MAETKVDLICLKCDSFTEDAVMEKYVLVPFMKLVFSQSHLLLLVNGIKGRFYSR